MVDIIARGFRGRRPGPARAVRIPPGQYPTDDFPVLSAGPTPRTLLADWSFSLTGLVDRPRQWTWEAFLALPIERITVDIHCVTRWSKLDTTWEGVSVDTLLDGAATDAAYAVAVCDGGYTTNLPLADLIGGRAWVAFAYGGEPLAPEHGGPARLLVPTSTSRRARSGSAGLNWSLRTSRGSGRRTATTTGATRGVSSATRVTDVVTGIRWWTGEVTATVRETARAVTIALAVPGWPGHRPGQHVDIRLTAADGYQAARSYSIANPPEADGVGIRVERLEDGEVSPYLVDEVDPGDRLELRGPIGGHFVWEAALGGPLLLVAGGSGVVPLIAMLRHRAAAGSAVRVRPCCA